jgi:16S rRNA processing protein RimM
MKDYYLIAKVVSVYGKKGFVKILSYSDFPERFFKLKKVYIDFFGDKKVSNVENVKQKGDTFFLRFSNFNSAEDAGILLGKELFVDEKEVIKLPEYTFFIHDLIESEIIEEGKKLGKIKDVLSFPANDVYVIETPEGKELLIPAVKDFIERFDPVEKILVLKPGSGLYEDES